MRRADTESRSPHNIGGVKRRTKERPKPSLPKTPWDDDQDALSIEDRIHLEVTGHLPEDF